MQGAGAKRGPAGDRTAVRPGETCVNDQAPVELTVRFHDRYRPDSELIRGRVKLTEITKGVANDVEARRLLVRAGDEVYRIRRIRHRNGQNFLLEDATLPAALFPGLVDET